MQPLKINRLLNLALSLMILDGGFIIAVQIFSYLIAYFFAQIPSDPGNIQSFSSFGHANFLISIISMLNLSVIVFKVASLANGFKIGNLDCYKQALRRLPSLTALSLIGVMIFFFCATPVVTLMVSMFNVPLINLSNLLVIAILALIPYGILACVFVVFEQKSPLQAIVATYKTVKHRISLNMLAILSLVYVTPFILKVYIPAFVSAPYLALFISLWFLFCHVLTIAVYADTVEITPIDKEKEDEKKTKVIVI